MGICKGIAGVPDFRKNVYIDKKSDYALLIPVINEGKRIRCELARAKAAGVNHLVDVILCDGGSTDDSLENLTSFGVNTLLTKIGAGRQGAQLRMGMYFALNRGYSGILTIDGNNKDSIESVPLFLEKLRAGYDFVQGSRFLTGGKAQNTPVMRYLALRALHAPIISLAAGERFTDTTNAFRAYSRKYLMDNRVQPLRDIFSGYELLAYLSVRASQLGLKTCEVPVARVYPKGKTPTKISGFSGNVSLLKILFLTLLHAYDPKEGS